MALDLRDAGCCKQTRHPKSAECIRRRSSNASTKKKAPGQIAIVMTTSAPGLECAYMPPLCAQIRSMRRCKASNVA